MNCKTGFDVQACILTMLCKKFWRSAQQRTCFLAITYETIAPIPTCFTSEIYFGRIAYNVAVSPGAFGVFQEISRMLAFNHYPFTSKIQYLS